MSLEGMTRLVTQLRSEIDNEEKRLEDNLQSAIQRVVSETGIAYQTVFSDVISGLESTGEILKQDLQTIESGIEKVVAVLESTAEREYQFFSNSVEASITKIKGVASDVSSTVSSATSYLRTGAAADFDAVISTARKDFEKAKSNFKLAISAISADVISKTKAGLDSIVSSAQSDLDRLERMKTSVLSDINSKVSTIVSDLKNVKDRATTDLERIVGFIKREADKLEERIDKMEARVNRFGLVIAAVALTIAVASSIRLIQQAQDAKTARLKSKNPEE
jgi:hypothetical protein